jgi:prepilin-type N-terminal cleavage/methylation domain-containing protein
MIKSLKSAMDRKEQGDEGFTLIELLIVIVVLGILAAVVVFALGSVTGNAKASACNADAKTVATAVQAYNAQKAPTLIVAETGITVGTPATFSTGTQANLLVTDGYLNAWPGYNNSYAIALATATDITAGAHAGDVMVYTPSTAIATTVNGITDYNTEGSFGCNSL